jgi:hypothetical protein
MKPPPDLTPLRRQAADTLRRARKMPRGPYRNDLRQLASGLLRLEKMNLGARQSPGWGFSDFQNKTGER